MVDLIIGTTCLAVDRLFLIIILPAMVVVVVVVVTILVEYPDPCLKNHLQVDKLPHGMLHFQIMMEEEENQFYLVIEFIRETVLNGMILMHPTSAIVPLATVDCLCNRLSRIDRYL